LGESPLFVLGLYFPVWFLEYFSFFCVPFPGCYSLLILGERQKRVKSNIFKDKKTKLFKP